MDLLARRRARPIRCQVEAIVPGYDASTAAYDTAEQRAVDRRADYRERRHMYPSKSARGRYPEPDFPCPADLTASPTIV